MRFPRRERIWRTSCSLRSSKKYHADSDVSLFPLIVGAYAPSAVVKMFAEVMANPPKDATPDHLREMVELCAAASRGY